MLIPLAPAIWELNAPLTVFGMALGHRMTVVRLPDGALWLHSPVAHSPELGAALGKLGRVAHIVAPSCVHDTYLEGWFGAYPNAQFHGARGFQRSRPDLRFTRPLSDEPDPAWGGALAAHVLRGMPRLNETAFLHHASGTLILTDLCFNLGPDMPFLSRVLLQLNGCYCTFGPSRLLRSVIKDRAALRASLDRILAWDFERVVVSHGQVVPLGGKAMLRDAFAFLR